MKVHVNRWGGHTYFRRWGFSLNEGVFPNIHVSWARSDYRFFFYVAITRRLKWWWVFK